MITLAKVTKLTREFIRWGVVLVIAAIILSILIRVGINIRNKYFPPAPPPPTAAFGKLPQPAFPKSITSSEFSFTIDTLTGTLPTVPTQVKVYKTEENQPGLLSLERARQRVGSLGFKSQERQITQTLYQWTDAMGRTIRFDLISFDFDIMSNFYSNPQVLESKDLPSSRQAVENVKKLLTDIELLAGEIDLEKSKTSFFSIVNGSLTPASSQASSQIIKVDLIQKPIENLPIVYPNKNTSLMSFLVAAVSDQNKIVEAHFFWRPVNNNPSTYPIKTPEQAFADLQNGNSYILSINDKTKTDIAIKNVYLAYFVSRETSSFLYPVYVFEGDNGFTAYVSALTVEFIENGESSR